MSASDGEQDAETDVDEPKRKRPKVLQKYLPGYQVKYPVSRHSSVSENHAYCTVCRCDFGVGHGGMGDVAVVLARWLMDYGVKLANHRSQGG